MKFFALFLAALGFAFPARAAAPPLVLLHPAVIDPALGSLSKDMAIEVREGRIAAVRPAVEYRVPEGARVLDLAGRFVVPGFVEMHAHLLLHPWGPGGEILPQYDRGAMLAMLETLLDFGVTTVRDPGAPTEAAGRLREMVAEGKVVGPRVLTAGRIMNASAFNPEPFAPVQTAEEVRAEVRWQAAAGVDFVKVYASMPPELVRVAVEEAHALGLRVIGHLQRTTWTEAAEIGVDAVTHTAPWSPAYLPAAARDGYEQSLFGRVYWLEQVDLAGPEVAAMVAALARDKVAVDPTLIALHTKFWGNDPRYLAHPERARAPAVFWQGWPQGSFTASWSDEQYRLAQAQWPRALALTKALFDGGVLLTVGTDTPSPWVIPGVSFHEELQLLADAGIPAPDVLRMATLNGGIALGLEGEIGRVRAGLVVDLVVLRENPLLDVGNLRQIVWVVRGGVLHEPAAGPPPAPR